MGRLLRVGPVWTCLVGLAACEPAGDEDEGDSGVDELCGDLSGFDEFVVGLSKTGQQSTVTFVDAMPAPPIRDFNTWILQVESIQDEPLEDVTWEVFPWMPDHGHGSPTPVEVLPGTKPGQYVLDPVNLHMAGRWTIDLTLTLPDDRGIDEVQFAFCVR